MTYKNLFGDFLKLFPEDIKYFNEKMEELLIDSNDGMHIVFGMVIVPFIENLLEEQDVNKLKIAFNFFEKMASSKNTEICEVLEFTILEELISKGKMVLNEYKKYMGKDTLECCNEIEKCMNIH